MSRLALILRFALAILPPPRSLLAAGSLTMIACGFWMAWTPLGLIVPGVLVFACLVFGRLREEW